MLLRFQVDFGETGFADPLERPVDPGSNSATYKMLRFLLVLQPCPNPGERWSFA